MTRRRRRYPPPTGPASLAIFCSFVFAGLMLVSLVARYWLPILLVLGAVAFARSLGASD